MSWLKFALRTLKTLISLAEKDKLKIVLLNPVVFFCLVFFFFFKFSLKREIWIDCFFVLEKTAVGHVIIQNCQWNWKSLGICGSEGLYCPLWWIDVCLGLADVHFYSTCPLEKRSFFLCMSVSGIVPANQCAEAVYLLQQQLTSNLHLRTGRVSSLGKYGASFVNQTLWEVLEYSGKNNVKGHVACILVEEDRQHQQRSKIYSPIRCWLSTLERIKWRGKWEGIRWLYNFIYLFRNNFRPTENKCQE